MSVVVIGASNKPDRYSYQAVKLLGEKGHTVFPVHQRVEYIDGITVYRSVRDIGEPVDTITLYVNAGISDKIADDMLNMNVRRIIFNPGAENSVLGEKARERNIIAINACTLVLLRTGQF